ncbi:RNase adapter RapZ [Aestuariibius sp. HNIBRBA575]|uniref:RNase adapter RapZ n=1 Tax=Aestuariibius sp. HNIBRBA575 TaxID=3233343 RepID=UPI0034A1BB1C
MPALTPSDQTKETSETDIDDASQHVLFVTGPSGAGRSTAIKTLEDLGYEVIDNLPISLLPHLLDAPPIGRPLALGLDVRNRDFQTDTVISLIDRLSAGSGVDAQVLYLDCSVEVLVRRYSETRRRHPLAPADPPLSGITKEIELLVPIRARADFLIDTSNLSPHDLKADIEAWFAPDGAQGFGVSVQSFSYKRGLPRGIDIVLDCRFLRNPYWDPSLRQMDGRSKDVDAYVAADERFDEFYHRVFELISFLLPSYKAEGKSHLSIGFGCTGGQHRSVAVTERMAKSLARADWRVSIRHRELERRADVLAPAKSGKTGQ